MTEDQGFRFELAKEVLSGEIGRRVSEIRTLPSGDERASMERDLIRVVHLKNRLFPGNTRVVDAILDKDLAEALEDEPPLRRAI